ncbi:putative membrane channel-forming protein YqfA (hemolysin III family) [Spirosoma lacussanchae]|uniref:DUF3810 domain-containing protein n=1 Tax=Spirosoma lacussanchae TaxID=1884249 RepID=UPI00110935DC|nr:DUF3810 domain-containing protein [Spirosoma lacussanchae]
MLFYAEIGIRLSAGVWLALEVGALDKQTPMAIRLIVAALSLIIVGSAAMMIYTPENDHYLSAGAYLLVGLMAALSVIDAFKTAENRAIVWKRALPFGLIVGLVAAGLFALMWYRKPVSPPTPEQPALTPKPPTDEEQRNRDIINRSKNRKF